MFWKDWIKTEKNTFFSLLAFLLIIIIFFCFSWFRGLENVISYDILSELDEIPTVLDSFSDGKLSFTVNSNAYLIKDKFLASPMKTNFFGNYIFIIGFVLGLCSLLAAFSKLSRYWFLGGMTALAGIFISFRFENIFQNTNQIAFLVVFVLFIGLAFYINSYANFLNIPKRFALFLGLSLLVGGFLVYFSKIKLPILALGNYGLISAIILSAIFIILISHEILAGLVWVVTNSKLRGQSSVNQFLIISSIYLANILLIYLEKTKIIDWNLVPISPFFLYLISMILGIWGFQKFSEQTNVFNFKTSGNALYLGLAIISTSTIGFAFSTANDPLIEAFEDFIIIAHLCVGIAFFIYILVNFIQPLQQGLVVHRVIYKPKFLEFSLFRLGCLIAIFALISFKNFFTYYQTLAGYNNALADYFYASEDWATAEVFYKEATHTDIYNHKSNYGLASLAMKMGDKNNTGFFLKNAIYRSPSPQAYIGLSKTLQDNDMFFDALFTMKEGATKFPKNQEILNNLAFLYEKSKILDSALVYLKLAENHCSDCDLAKSNLFYYDLKYNEGKEKISEISKNFTEKNISLRVNRMALYLLKKRDFNSGKIEFPTDSLLSINTMALIYNQAQVKNNQFTVSNESLRKIQQKAGNEDFMNDLSFARACQNYYHENKIEGIKQLANLAMDSTQKRQMYRQTVGMWFLQNGVYDKSLEFLSKAGDISSVELLKTQDYQQVIHNFQKEQAKELLKSKDENSIKMALKTAPLNPEVVEVAVIFFNQNKKEKEAYELVFEAVELNEKSVELWKIYSLQSLKIGMKEYAEDGLLNIQVLASPTDYQGFLSIYQAQKALMEKSMQGFE